MTSISIFTINLKIPTEDIQKLISLGGTIMSKIVSDFADKMNHFDTQSKAIDGIQGDLKTLKDQIAALQNSVGTITPEDQALLDGIEGKAGAVSAAVDALDQMTPPAIPPGA